MYIWFSQISQILIYDLYNAHRLRNKVRQMLHFGSWKVVAEPRHFVRQVVAELRHFVRQVADKLVADLG